MPTPIHPPTHAPAHSCIHPPSRPEIALKRVRSDCRAEVARAEARVEQLEKMIFVMATAPKEMSETPYGGSNSTTMALLLHAVEGGHSNAIDTLLAMTQVNAGCTRASQNVRAAPPSVPYVRTTQSRPPNSTNTHPSLHVQEDVLAPVHYHAAPVQLSLFLVAVSKGNLALSLQFLEMGADIHEECSSKSTKRLGKKWSTTEGATALQLAAASGCYQLVEELVTRGALFAGTAMMVPNTDDGHRIVQFLQSRGSNQCTRFTPQEVNPQLLTSTQLAITSNTGLVAAINAGAGLGSKQLALGEVMYNAELDGWEASDFHRTCDGKGALLFLMRTTDDALIGAFSQESWKSIRGAEGLYVTDPNAFLFEIHSDGTMTKCTIKPGVGHAPRALHGQSNLGPTFGSSPCDLAITSKPNENDSSADVHHSYTGPPGDELLSYSGGGRKFFRLKSLVAVAVV